MTFIKTLSRKAKRIKKRLALKTGMIMKKGNRSIGRADKAVKYLCDDEANKVFANGSEAIFKMDPETGLSFYDNDVRKWLVYTPKNWKSAGHESDTPFEDDTFNDIEEEVLEPEYETAQLADILKWMNSLFKNVSKTACRDDHIVQQAMESVAEKVLTVCEQRYQKVSETIRIGTGDKG